MVDVWTNVLKSAYVVTFFPHIQLNIEIWLKKCYQT